MDAEGFEEEGSGDHRGLCHSGAHRPRYAGLVVQLDRLFNRCGLLRTDPGDRAAQSECVQGPPIPDLQPHPAVARHQGDFPVAVDDVLGLSQDHPAGDGVPSGSFTG